MSRRLEITVPNDWALPVRECLEDPLRCNLSERLEKANMIVEIRGVKNTIFFVTIPGPVVSGTLEMLRKNGIGTTVGRIILSSLDFLKPELSKPLTKPDVTLDSMAELEGGALVPAPAPGKKAAPLKGFQHFQKARKTTEEMYNDISNGANMNINTWLNLIGASTMAAGGLTSNVLVFIVAAMLVSPIMGPILGMTLGYRVADWPLFRTGFINEMKMALATFTVGCLVGLTLGGVGNTYKWPNSAMMPEGQAFNLIISIVVSAAAGMVLGVSLTSTGGNALVGTAISAGLLPPLVNAGMLMAYAWAYAHKDDKKVFYELSGYSIVFYISHVITIVIVANIMFWLKDIDPRFKDGEDSNFNDIPSLVEHKRRLMENGKELTEREKAEFFIGHIKDDLTDFTVGLKDKAIGLKDKASGIANVLTGGRIGKRQGDQSEHSYATDDTKERDLEMNTNESNKRRPSINSQKSFFLNPSLQQSNKGRRGSGAHRGSFSQLGSDDSDGVELTHQPTFSNTSELTSIAEESTTSRSNTRKKDYRLVAENEGNVVNPMQQQQLSGQSSGQSSSAQDYSLQPSTSTKLRNQRDVQQRVTDFYKQYNPDKLDSVPEILKKYEGQEEDLLRKLKKQYNVSDGPDVRSPSTKQRDLKDVQQRVTDFYKQYNPDKLDAVPEILKKYEGQEEDLLRRLKKQYGVDDL